MVEVCGDSVWFGLFKSTQANMHIQCIQMANINFHKRIKKGEKYFNGIWLRCASKQSSEMLKNESASMEEWKKMWMIALRGSRFKNTNRSFKFIVQPVELSSNCLILKCSGWAKIGWKSTEIEKSTNTKKNTSMDVHKKWGSNESITAIIRCLSQTHFENHTKQQNAGNWRITTKERVKLFRTVCLDACFVCSIQRFYINLFDLIQPSVFQSICDARLNIAAAVASVGVVVAASAAAFCCLLFSFCFTK